MKRDQLSEHVEVVSNDMNWEQFVLAYGRNARADHLAYVLGQPESAIRTLRNSRAVGASIRHETAKRFDELFTLWHGRSPTEAEWPAPRHIGGANYEWLQPELALVATLTGQLSTKEIAQTLTERLGRLTGDKTAVRTQQSVQLAVNRIGLQSSDVVGGITPSEAGKEIRSSMVVRHAIEHGELNVSRVGHRLVIPYADWEAWKAKRTRAPEGFVMLSTLKQPLGIKSDKLSEWARAGYVPTAVRCNTYGTRGPSTKFGTWHIDAKVAEQLILDRREGRPMPWHGKPFADNLGVTFKLWQGRKHPAECPTCAEIWGEGGTPQSYEEYALRYPPLAHGAKRHLTRPWTPGLTIDEVAQACACSRNRVTRAIQAGALTANRIGRQTYVAKTDATLWKARKCPTGGSEKSWLGLDTASKLYGFTLAELEQLIADGTLKSKVGENGPMRGLVYVLRQQCAEYRQKNGYTEQEAADRLKVSVEELRHLLSGVNWRGASSIPLDTINAVRKRIESSHGYTFEEAAELLGTTVEWIEEQRDRGTFRVLKTRWNEQRAYISAPMLDRLRFALAHPGQEEQFSSDWLRLSDAADEAGVSIRTIAKWVDDDELSRRPSKIGWRYHRDAVRARAREYWKTVRFHRATPPQWLQDELHLEGVQ
jgi:AraC-like DNA-binding protein